MKTDKESIVSALKLWFREGDVFEIRVLDALSPEWMRPHMESGYFGLYESQKLMYSKTKLKFINRKAK